MLQRLLDDRIPATELPPITAHVEGCAVCRQMLEQMTHTIGQRWKAVISTGRHAASGSTDSFLGRLLRRTAPTMTELLPAAPMDSAHGDDLHRAGYDLMEAIGRGVHGVVYKARQRSDGRTVAIKVLRQTPRSSSLLRFRREVDALAWMRHTNLVRILAVGEADGRPYLVMEFADGGSLDRLLDRGPLPVAVAARLVADMARGIHTAHEHGIVHRDLKPANVLLCVAPCPSPAGNAEKAEADGRRPLENGLIPKIADFGLAKHLDDLPGATQSGAIIGTPHYMAPEQAESRLGEIGPAADVYALGAILYEALTGRPPFQGASVPAVLEQVRSQQPVPARQLRPEVPAELEQICARCLCKDPADRYASAALLADQLEPFLQSNAPVTPPSVAPRQPPGVVVKQAAVAFLALALFLVMAVLGVWSLYHSVVSSPPPADVEKVLPTSARERASTPTPKSSSVETVNKVVTWANWLKVSGKRGISEKEAQRILGMPTSSRQASDPIYQYHIDTWTENGKNIRLGFQKGRQVSRGTNLRPGPGEPLLPPPLLTQENFDRIQRGWTEEQLMDLLGHWSTYSGGTSDPRGRYTWTEGLQKWFIELENGRLISKSRTGGPGKAP
jgi:serine/threonine protein kinase